MFSKIMLVAAVTLQLLSGFGGAEPTNGENGKTVPAGNAAIDKYNEDNIKVTRSLMSPKNVSDAFGRRIGKRYIALQITVANRNAEYQWLITDASVDMARIIGYMGKSCAQRAQSLIELTAKSANPTLTGADLTVLRGVAEKGQNYDPRNLSVRVLQGTGTIAAGLLGVTMFGPAFAPSVAAFNGPLITAVQRIFPDETINQMNRLNDSAYGANLLVPKQQSKVMVVFIPVATLLNSDEQKKFYADPNSVYSGCTDLRLLNATVNGHPIAQLDLTPSITNVEISATEAAKFGTDNFKVAGVLNGRNLDKATLELSGAPDGLTIKTTGTPSSEQIAFELASAKPLRPNLPVTLVLRKPDFPVRTWSISASWVPQRPTIASAGIAPASIKQGEKKTIEISGSGFLPDAQLDVEKQGLTVGDVAYVSTSKLRVDIAVADSATAGSREISVRTVGGDSGKAALTIAAK